MNPHIAQRTINLAKFIVKHNATIRQAAQHFNISKSTVWHDLTTRLPKLDADLADVALGTLAYNKMQRASRGGQALAKRRRKVAEDEFSKSLTRSLRQFAPVLLGEEKPKSNAKDFIDEMKKWDEEVSAPEPQKVKLHTNKANINKRKKRPLKSRYPKDVNRACFRKKRHLSLDDAYEFLRELHGDKWKSWNAYRCVVCDGWHVTRR